MYKMGKSDMKYYSTKLFLLVEGFRIGYNTRQRNQYIHNKSGPTGPNNEGSIMSGSVYKIIELVGTSNDSWELAAKNAVERAGQSLRDLRIAEVVTLDMKVEDNNVIAYRARLKASFKFES